MREIKFRMYDKPTNSIREVFEINFKTRMADCQPDREEGFLNLNIDYSPLMQYTGLKDKDSKYIYEGDLVRLPNNDIGEISYANGGFLISNYYLGQKLFQKYYDIIICTNCQVLGNKYEYSEYFENYNEIEVK